jgi:hypothetical protein
VTFAGRGRRCYAWSMHYLTKLGTLTALTLSLAQTGCGGTCEDCCSAPPFEAPIVTTRVVGVNGDGRPEIEVGSMVSTCQLSPNGRVALVWTAQASVDIGEDSGGLTNVVQDISPIHFESFDLTVTESDDAHEKTYTFASGGAEVTITCTASDSDASCGHAP